MYGVDFFFENAKTFQLVLNTLNATPWDTTHATSQNTNLNISAFHKDTLKIDFHSKAFNANEGERNKKTREQRRNTRQVNVH